MARPVILEVERKFVPGAQFVRRLEANKGTPSFRQIRSLKQSIFEDTYYDFQDHLCSNGVWLRARNGVWQAKVRLGGDFVNSQFKEIDDVSEILKLVRNHVPRVDAESAHFGLPVFARIETSRHTWLADDRFKIVFDTTDFGHEIGEVELEQSCSLAVHIDDRRNHILQSMDQDIERFMTRYRWAFNAGSEQPIGKLSAYFAHRQAMQKTVSTGCSGVKS